MSFIMNVPHLPAALPMPALQAKAGAGSATLSMAYAASRFVEACLRAMAGEVGVVECAFVASSLVTDLPFFASQLRLGPGGIAGRWGRVWVGAHVLPSKILPTLPKHALGGSQ